MLRGVHQRLSMGYDRLKEHLTGEKTPVPKGTSMTLKRGQVALVTSSQEDNGEAKHFIIEKWKGGYQSFGPFLVEAISDVTVEGPANVCVGQVTDYDDVKNALRRQFNKFSNQITTFTILGVGLFLAAVWSLQDYLPPPGVSAQMLSSIWLISSSVFALAIYIMKRVIFKDEICNRLPFPVAYRQIQDANGRWVYVKTSEFA